MLQISLVVKEHGIFELIMSIFMFASTFANSGISLAATRIVAEELDGNNGKGLKTAMKKCILYSLFFGIIACLLLTASAKYCSSVLLHGKITPIPLYIMAISLPFSSVITSLSGYFTGIRRVSKTSVSRILTMLLQISFTCLFLYLFPSNNLSIVCTYLILGMALSTIFEFILTYILYIVDLRKKLTRSISGETYLKKILRIALPVAITSYIRSGLSTLKQMLIPFSLEKYSVSCDEALSQYGQINGMTMPIIMFPCIIITSCASLLIPEFARYNLKKDFTRMNQVTSFIFKFTSFFSICIIGVFLTFPEEICYFIYHNLEITDFLVLLCPLIILIYLDKIIDAMLRGLDKQVGVMFCNIFDLISTIILIYTIVPVFGIYGYIAIIAISELLNFTISLIQLYKATHFKFDFISYVIIPSVLVLTTKFLFDVIDDYIEYDVGFVIFKVLIFIGVYLLLLGTFNIFKFIRNKKIFCIRCTK
jgi:stage V sporulation protein B